MKLELKCCEFTKRSTYVFHKIKKEVKNNRSSLF